MLELKNVGKRYHMGSNIVHALNGVSLTVEGGDFVAIMGPSGSGKSTLMHVMGLLDVPDEGSYKINGEEVSRLQENELAELRHRVIGFVFQQFNLLPRMTALENVALPLLYSAGKPDTAAALRLLSQVGLENRVGHHSNEMSGGQQQRVAIARSLINRPLVLFADEPTGNLDSSSTAEIMNILKDLNRQGMTIVMVTHEEDIGRQAKRIIRMKDGAVQEDTRLSPLEGRAAKAEVSARPAEKHSYLQGVFRYFRQGVRTLIANKVRTALSMLGILIGVGAVVTMMALGAGAQKAIEERLSSLGSNLLMLRSGSLRGAGGARLEAGSASRLTVGDVGAIEKIPAVKQAAPIVNGRGQVTYLNKNHNTLVIGVSSAYAAMHDDVPMVGRFFTELENQRRSRVAVIGMTLVRELFDGESPIGEVIKINKVSFHVIGVLPEKGAGGFQDQDDRILMPVDTAMRRLLGKDYVDSIDIEVATAEQTSIVEQKALDLMYERHKVPLSQRDQAFQVRNMAEIQEALSSSTQIMTLLLSAIAAISLLVGGIGIMNIMLVSVTERTREIGLRKAIGAKRGDILAQFLAEAVVVSLIGGTLGIVLAWLATAAISTFAGWATSITLSSVLLAFFFSTFVGIVFGLYPARKASLLAPIDALRYE